MDNDYMNWSLPSLFAEISKRKLINKITEDKFPNSEDRKRRLVSLLEGDDRLLDRHPEILKYGHQKEEIENE